ncbi:MAG: hypothetical protein ACT4N4_04745 [Rhodospirillales bacterium]
MADAAKILVLNDQAYVSPYLMRPLRRLEEVERDQAARKPGDAKQGKETKPERRLSAGQAGRLDRGAA